MEEILIKVKTRDKKMFTKKFYGGGGQFSWGKITPGKIAPHSPKKKKKKKKIDSRKNYILGKM